MTGDRTPLRERAEKAEAEVAAWCAAVRRYDDKYATDLRVALGLDADQPKETR